MQFHVLKLLNQFTIGNGDLMDAQYVAGHTVNIASQLMYETYTIDKLSQYY